MQSVCCFYSFPCSQTARRAPRGTAALRRRERLRRRDGRQPAGDSTATRPNTPKEYWSTPLWGTAMLPKGTLAEHSAATPECLAVTPKRRSGPLHGQDGARKAALGRRNQALNGTEHAVI